jgi:hypothetical protein
MMHTDAVRSQELDCVREHLTWKSRIQNKKYSEEEWKGTATWGCPRRRLPCRRDSPAPLYRTSGGWLSFGWL